MFFFQIWLIDSLTHDSWLIDLFDSENIRSQADGDLVLIKTFFAFLWKLSLKNTS